MLDGVVVDPLTETLLDVVTNRGQGDDLERQLRVFFHDARNRLNALKIGLYLARRGGAVPARDLWGELDASYEGLELLVKRLQTLCRPIEIDPVEADLAAWFQERRPIWEGWFRPHGAEFILRPPGPPVIGRFDPLRLVQGLDALLAWRASEARDGDSGSLRVWGDSSHTHIEWTEVSSKAEEVPEGSDGRTISLALPILAQVVSAHGGSTAVGYDGGLLVRIAWPVQAEVPEPA